MGWNDEMKTNLDATKAQVAAQLNEFLDYKKKDFEAKRDEISKVLPAAQKDKFTNAKSLTRADLTAMGLTTTQIDEFLQAYAIVAQATQEANEKGNQIVQAQYQAIVKAYQEAAAPSIRRVAVASNRQVVLQPMGALYTDPQIDLTDGVVDDLRKTNSSKVELPPIPKLNIPMPEKK
jgi:Skp family chaperone for outer membrane proteins